MSACVRREVRVRGGSACLAGSGSGGDVGVLSGKDGAPLGEEEGEGVVWGGGEGEVVGAEG